jgi:hypothetical protein
VVVARVGGARDLFRDAATELPANPGLDCEDDVVHFYLSRTACVLCVDIRVGEDVCSISVREVEELVQDCGLDILDGGCGRE